MHAEIFIQMLQIEEAEWAFQEDKQKMVGKLCPFYSLIMKNGIGDILKSFVKELADYRNGFDHAWTCKSGAYEDIKKKGEIFLKNLDDVIQLLENHHILL